MDKYDSIVSSIYADISEATEDEVLIKTHGRGGNIHFKENGCSQHRTPPKIRAI